MIPVLVISVIRIQVSNSDLINKDLSINLNKKDPSNSDLMNKDLNNSDFSNKDPS